MTIGHHDKQVALSALMYQKASKTARAKGKLAAYADAQKRANEVEAFEKGLLSKHTDAP